MTIEERLYLVVTSDPAWIASGAKLYATEAAQDATFPFARYQMIAIEFPMSAQEAQNLNLRAWRFQFAAFGYLYSDASNLIKIIENRLVGYVDLSQQIGAVSIITERASFEKEIKIHQKAVDLMVIGNWQ